MQFQAWVFCSYGESTSTSLWGSGLITSTGLLPALPVYSEYKQIVCQEEIYRERNSHQDCTKASVSIHAEFQNGGGKKQRDHWRINFLLQGTAQKSCNKLNKSNNSSSKTAKYLLSKILDQLRAILVICITYSDLPKLQETIDHITRPQFPV